MGKYTSLYGSFEKAAERLDEVLALEETDVVRDSAIQRFEICFELAWKTLKTHLEEEHNAVCSSPRSCFREAFHQGIIKHDPFWIELTVLRNYTSHTYNEKMAKRVYEGLPEALRHFQELLKKLK